MSEDYYGVPAAALGDDGLCHFHGHAGEYVEAAGWAFLTTAAPEHEAWRALPVAVDITTGARARIYGPPWLDFLFYGVSYATNWTSYALSVGTVARIYAAVGGAEALAALYALGGEEAVANLGVRHALASGVA